MNAVPVVMPREARRRAPAISFVTVFGLFRGLCNSADSSIDALGDVPFNVPQE